MKTLLYVIFVLRVLNDLFPEYIGASCHAGHLAMHLAVDKKGPVGGAPALQGRAPSVTTAKIPVPCKKDYNGKHSMEKYF